MFTVGEENLSCVFFRSEKLRQCLHIGLAEFVCEVFFPAPAGPEMVCQCLNRVHGTYSLSSVLSLFELSALCSGRIAGNRMTSRIDGESVNSMARRSMPIPSPAVGGKPYSSAIT